MTDRPAVLSAKVDRQAAIIADADDLKQMPKSDRPNSATVDEVRVAYRDAMQELQGGKGSVAAVEGITLPQGRL